MRQTARLIIRYQSYIERSGNVPASLKDVLINDYLVLTAATVLRHAEDDVGRAVEPRRPRPPRPNAQALEFRYMRKYRGEPVSQ